MADLAAHHDVDLPADELTTIDWADYYGVNGPAPERWADPDAFKLVVQTAADLCDEPDTNTGRLLGPLILQGARTIVVGDTGEGKTSLAFQLIRTALDGSTFLDWHGENEGGRALIIDLEQGRRSVKRALRENQLAERTDVDLVLVPDGLSLDSDNQHRAELERVIGEGHYTIVALDPYYKAHRAAEPNAERPIVDLMRTLDKLRTDHGFALLLPAHPRKEPPGAPAIRKLTIHDIAGSGAVTRGAEVVLGIERIAHGHARLRFLKDREGELPINEAYTLLYSKEDGFTRNPSDLEPDRDYQADILILAADERWRTLREYRDELKAGDKTTRYALNALQQEGHLEYAEGPPGRKSHAKCWRLATASQGQRQLEAPEAVGMDEGATASVPSPSLGRYLEADAPTSAATTPKAEAHHTTEADDDIPF